ncbi:2-octaprenylphenol hydroxylase [Geoalkalibacter ferrihydriticus]|uniref:Ubiquinone biosynthesis protein UbiB n=2 Tax=Geoalkalibacter ferrihydriticus TaxID=392333 RepID=A0A0C2DUB9_9BACT|nr:AarF/ABC1/UbiB kinase family protein [Geoalkalibacter ferrihydriticus]KIH77044.1 ubiquinone biosynthesis protein UbiB [Geoalkalibacter ferrihydriticus DSM 17813]SDL37503.1 2-octaprenylphenol hydroxylase [Geoalkalibacter ferrihydriticus]
MLTFTRINRNIRSIKRYRNILGILIKYGFGHVVEQLNIDYYLELGRRIVTLGTAPKNIDRLSQAERLRLAMEELGPTFVKLGQILSTRPDVIPREYIEELSKLQDNVPPVPVAELQAQIQKELGQPVEDLFAYFDPEPIAAASIAQVHRARLISGEEVVVKARRPGIAKTIEIDLDIMAGLAYLVENHLPGGDLYDPSGLVKEFRRTIHREMDFTREGHTIDRFAANFEGDETVYFPTVFWEVTGDTVLTMEYIEGFKVSDLDLLRSGGYDLKTIAHRGADFFLTQVLVHGMFHGDPHPGNFFILEENVICLLDYGMVGRVDDDLKQHLIDLLLGILNRDVDRILTLMLFSGDITEETDRKGLKRDLYEFIDDYYEMPLGDLNVGRLLMEFVDLMNAYRIKFPADLMLLAKALVTVEGLGRQLDPEFNMIEHLQPFIKKMVHQRLSPGNISRGMYSLVESYTSLVRNLPRDLKEFINRVNRNKFKIDLEHRGLEKLISEFDKSSNRLSFSLIIGALIVGSSLIIQSDKGPQLFDFPVLGLLGYSIAGVLGLWLAIAILRSGRL